MLGTCFAHMLPDARESWEGYVKAKDKDWEYPVVRDIAIVRTHGHFDCRWTSSWLAPCSFSWQSTFWLRKKNVTTVVAVRRDDYSRTWHAEMSPQNTAAMQSRISPRALRCGFQFPPHYQFYLLLVRFAGARARASFGSRFGAHANYGCVQCESHIVTVSCRSHIVAQHPTLYTPSDHDLEHGHTHGGHLQARSDAICALM